MRETPGASNESRVVPILRDTLFARLTAPEKAIQQDAHSAGARFSPVKFDIRRLARGHMEISTEENEAIVRRICNSVTAAAEDRVMITPEQQNIYDVDYLVMEVNSGASFEQYFRWASVDEISTSRACPEGCWDRRYR